MGTTSEELKKLYAKLGGKDPKVAGFSAPGEILNAINEIPLPTEYELPTVTTEDAGDVLVVNDEGKWDKGEAGSGVIPNPEGEATVDLTKLGIDDTVYGIPKELPAVTTDDNGNVLTVVEGAWAKAAPSGGTLRLICKRNGNVYYFPDGMKASDICNLIDEGKSVEIITSETSVVQYRIFRIMSIESGTYVFIEFYMFSGNVFMARIELNSTSSSTYFSVTTKAITS